MILIHKYASDIRLADIKPGAVMYSRYRPTKSQYEQFRCYVMSFDFNGIRRTYLTRVFILFALKFSSFLFIYLFFKWHAMCQRYRFYYIWFYKSKDPSSSAKKDKEQNSLKKRAPPQGLHALFQTFKKFWLRVTLYTTTRNTHTGHTKTLYCMYKRYVEWSITQIISGGSIVVFFHWWREKRWMKNSAN